MRKMIPLFKTLIDSGETFNVQCTNNFYQIEWNGAKFKFFSGMKTNYTVFNVARELKNDIINRGVEVDETSIEEYFSSNQDLNFDLSEKMYCIDIKKAYVTVLKNDGIISEEMYNKICGLKKTDRLRVTGMLARKKSIYNYKDGKMSTAHMERQPTERYFFYCVERTYLVMSEIARKLGDDFMFFWVDCVFFVGERNINFVMDCLRSKRFEFTLERMRLLGIAENKTYKSFRFLKSGRVKEYNVPNIKDTDLLSKARHCFVTENFKGFKHYLNEYETLRKSVSQK